MARAAGQRRQQALDVAATTGRLAIAMAAGIRAPCTRDKAVSIAEEARRRRRPATSA